MNAAGSIIRLGCSRADRDMVGEKRATTGLGHLAGQHTRRSRAIQQLAGLPFSFTSG